jgi:Na+-driven multidrug efflux pump
MLGLRVIALAQPFWAVGIVAGGALRGSGDTRTPMLITAGGFWSAVALAYLGVNGLALGNLALWAGLALPAPAMAAAGWLSARGRLPRARALVAEA